MSFGEQSAETSSIANRTAVKGNEHARNNKYFATAKEFRQSIDEFFDNTLPEIGHAFTSRINDNCQTFNFSS